MQCVILDLIEDLKKTAVKSRPFLCLFFATRLQKIV
jgi:hypothetical protein